MRLDEAKEILNKSGYIIEDTETQDDEMTELRKQDSISNFKMLKKVVDLEGKHLDLKDKIKNARKFNNSGFINETYFRDVCILIHQKRGLKVKLTTNDGVASMTIKTKLIGDVSVLLIVRDEYISISLNCITKKFKDYAEIQIDDEHPYQVAEETAEWIDGCLEEIF